MIRATGLEMLFHILMKEGVDVVFGSQRKANVPLYTVINEKFNGQIKYIGARHEQAAAHMADGFARASGNPGVVICNSGSAAINTLTGIATANMDSSPIIVFVLHLDAYDNELQPVEKLENIGIPEPCCKHSYRVKKSLELVNILKEAFHVAKSGRPGTMVVDILKSVLLSEYEFSIPEQLKLRGYKPAIKGSPLQIKRAIEMILSSKRPLIFGGGGLILSQATDELKAFATRFQIPVTVTLMGLGAYPPDDPMYINWIGMHGAYCANMAVHHSDLLIAIGARFDDRATGGNFGKFAPDAKIIHIDIDPATIDKNIRVHCPIVGDAKSIIKQILDMTNKEFNIDRKEWFKKIKDWDRENPLTYKQEGEKIKTTFVIDTLSKLTGGNAVIVSDVGQHQMWVAQFYKFKRPRTHITSGGLGTMGFGLPAAIGAKLARPSELVINVSGDGSFQMNMQEVATAVENNLDLKIFLINNQHHGMVRQWQTMFFDRNYSGSHFEVLPDFVRFAEALGARALRVTRSDRLELTIREALSEKGVILVEVVVDYEEMVYPMIAPGGAMNEMILDSFS
jgi:acetolactate synthase-1/2/3 large subunit